MLIKIIVEINNNLVGKKSKEEILENELSTTQVKNQLKNTDQIKA